ncbi:MAG: hypothetical protein HY698_17475 [Deltaproteobacteria bacterium]|nr:hypothetical protein [Deltaproteobacteria bacterium]
MTVATESAPSTNRALAERILDKWALATKNTRTALAIQTKWLALPDSIKQKLEQVGERLRNALDLPTKQEIAQLASRLDELDARLAQLASTRRGSAEASFAPSTTSAETANPVPPSTSQGATLVTTAALADGDAHSGSGSRKPQKTVAEKRVRKR